MAKGEAGLSLGIRSGVFPAKRPTPGDAVIGGFFPNLLDLVWIQLNYFHPVQYTLSVGSEAFAIKFRRAGLNLARGEHMNPALVVGEHSIPAFVIRAVAKKVLATVASSAIPSFDYEALVE